jgi:hypothetical protein
MLDIPALQSLIYKCESIAPLTDSELRDIDVGIVKALGWQDRFELPQDSPSPYPTVSFTGNQNPHSPTFTKSIYEVIPYLKGGFGFEISVPCPNKQLEALTGPLPSAVHMFNLGEDVSVVIGATTMELAFCAAWLTTIKLKHSKG